MVRAVLNWILTIITDIERGDVTSALRKLKLVLVKSQSLVDEGELSFSIHPKIYAVTFVYTLVNITEDRIISEMDSSEHGKRRLWLSFLCFEQVHTSLTLVGGANKKCKTTPL